MQKQAQAKRKTPATDQNSSTARELEQDELESNALQTSEDFDIEEALAAVDGIEVDDDEDFIPPEDASDLVEDYKNQSAPGPAAAQNKKRPKIIKADNVDDDVFNFSEFDLPEEDQPEPKKSAELNKKKTKSKKSNKKKTSRKSAKENTAPSKDASKQKSASKTPQNETRHSNDKFATTANEKLVEVHQNVISDPDVIIENNIPTLAIPKALLEDFEQEKIAPTNYRAMVTWGSLSVLMMLVFLAQTIYFKHNELGQISSLRPWVQMFCKHASCELSLQTDIGQIELLGQDIRSHPKSKGALLVSATIINNASFTQPYPGLQLSFSDINGMKVATRNFMPKDYLPSKFSRKKGMESNIPIQLELELVDPGKNAVNFEFDFFQYNP